jgi:hypothetical protein
MGLPSAVDAVVLIAGGGGKDDIKFLGLFQHISLNDTVYTNSVASSRKISVN